jgi:ParB/RepB/Spo0J family partition protein
MRSKQPMFGQIAAIVRYVPRKASTAGAHALSGVVGHKMTNDTKGGELQVARHSATTRRQGKPGDENKYEVVAGARRFRAAQLAELKTVPVRVVKLSDAAAIEAQVVENLQREDIHPLEEAFGFRSLLNLNDPNYTVATFAARAGKNEAYVLGRIKLTELIPPIADAFLADRITIGHALLIAKLPSSQQQEAFNSCFRQMWTNQGNTQILIPVRELAAWIESNILLELSVAPFSKSDEALVPEAGSCANCPKRTGLNALLFSDVRKDSCTDPAVFSSKSRCAYRQCDGQETGVGTNFSGLEQSRRRAAWTQTIRGIGPETAQVTNPSCQSKPRTTDLRKDGRCHCDGRRETRRDGQSLR